MKKDDLKNFPHLIRNISNWTEYTFYKGERNKRPLKFVTRPNPIQFEVSASLYWVFKEIFVEDFYRIQALLKKMPANPVVIDIGANAGFFDVLVLSKLRGAKIFAYEPVASNVRHIQKMIDQNPLLQQCLTVYPQAVTGKRKERVALYMEDTDVNSEIASVFSNFDTRNTKPVLVPAVTLSSILQQHPHADLLKMDCEGSEYGILYDTPAEELRKIKLMAIEVHRLDEDQNNVTALSAHLNTLGYQTTIAPITQATFYLEAFRNE